MKAFLAILAAASLLAAVPATAHAYGAIAVDHERGQSKPGYGFSVREKSEASAKARALRACKKAGNDNCRVVGWFKGCGAYAGSKRKYGYGFGKTKAIAVANALERCESDRCEVIVARCE